MNTRARRRSTGLVAASLAACVLLAGCERVEVEMRTTFNPDGSGRRHIEATASGPAATLLGAAARAGGGEVTVEPGTNRTRWQRDIRFADPRELAAAMPAPADLTGRLPFELPPDVLPPPDISFARSHHFVYTLFYYEETYPPAAGADRLDACPTCHGTGQVSCLHCGGTGLAARAGPGPCASCAGSGRQRCHVCGGTGANPLLALAGADALQPAMTLRSTVTLPGKVIRTNGRVAGADRAAWQLEFSELQSGAQLTAVSRRLNYLNLAVALAVPLAGIVTLLIMGLSGRRARAGAAPPPAPEDAPPPSVAAPQAPSPEPAPRSPPATAPTAPPAPPPALDFGPAAGREPVEVGRFRAAFSAGRMQEAALAATEATQFYPDDSRAWTALAQAHLAQGRLALAESAARRALQLAPDRPAEWFNLGVVLRLQDSPEEALKAYRRCLALNPDHTRAAADVRELLAASAEGDQGAAP